VLERDAELAALAAHWQRAQSDRGGMVVVCGEPGGGKTTLMQLFVDQLAGDVPVLWGACDPLTTPRPLGPLHDVASQLDAATRSALDEAAQPHEIFSAVSAWISAYPTILVIDDLHWADQGTVDLLRYLLRRVGATPSMIVGAVRDHELGSDHPVRALLGDVARSADAETVTVGPLSRAAIASLIDVYATDGRASGGPGVDAARIEGLTGGNPFFVTEVLARAGDEMPMSVRDAILARTAHLDAPAWDLLHLLACAPEAIADHLLAYLGVELPPLRDLDRAGLIRRTARGVAFRHDLCRLTIAGTIPPGAEAALHRRMLDALEASPLPDAAVLTHHSLGAGDAERISRYAVAAARAAARSGAHTQAAAFYRTALERGAPLDATDEAELLELLAEECYLTDRLEDAISACGRAMWLRERSDDVAGVSSNHHSLSVYQWYNANRSVAEGHAARAVDVLDDRPETHHDELVQLGHAFAMQAYLAIHASDLDRARRLVERAGEIASAAKDHPLTVRISLLHNICDVIEGDESARERILSIVGSANETFDEIYSSGYSNLSYLDVEQRRLHQAAEVLELSLPLTVERDLPICRVWQRGSLSRLDLIQGDWSAADAEATAVLSERCAPLARTWPHLVRGLVALRRVGEGGSDLDGAWALACRYGEHIRLLPAAAALAERMWLTGHHDDRVDGARSLLRGATRPGLEWARGELALWLQRLGVLDDSTREDNVDVAEPYRLQLAGMHVAAAELWATLGGPYERALALVDTGDEGQIRLGVDLLDRLGADAVADKVRLDLRALGGAVPSRRRASTLANPAGLTARQIDVLRLLDDGLTNSELAERLFISPKTVDHHISAILTKLQVGKRRDAVRVARELRLIE